MLHRDLLEHKKHQSYTGWRESERETKDIDLNSDSFVTENEDSIALTAFVNRIVQNSLKLDNFTVKVLDGAKASSLFAEYGIMLTYEYVVTICANDISEKCDKLTKFINHEVKAITPSIIFWEEGDKRVVEEVGSLAVVENYHSKDEINICSNTSFRKSKTVLPHWLDKKIYNDHKAIYAPEHKRYEYNLDLNDEELKVYLGTYFPRSYAEMFCIIDNLMQNECLKKTLEQDEISILDYGCGTGGEIIGFITAIEKHLPHTTINITAVDGNAGSLSILEDLVKSIPNNKTRVKLSTLCYTLNNNDDVEKVVFEKDRFHFILCDKMVCELISREVLPINAYAIIAQKLASDLQENGLLIILDVTTKDERSGYFYPQLMNIALNDYVRTSRTIETLLPLSCACYDGCKDLCFMQQAFSVSHSCKSNDESRVCYRVLCRKPLKDAILHGIDTTKFAHVVHAAKYKQGDDSAICLQSRSNVNVIDSFNINL